MRYFIEFSYHGKNYFGYQIQPNEISVQEVVERVLSTLFRSPIKITGAGRTDTGVHAKKMFAHFDFSEFLEDDIVARLNRFLPPDIVVRRLFLVREGLHARFDALYRTYEYIITTEKNPFLIDFSWQVNKNLDIEAMNKACKILVRYKDFSSFSKKGADNKTGICTIYFAQWLRREAEVVFTIKADRFLRNMVRAIVGTMVEVGTGKKTVPDFKTIIERKNRFLAGPSAPAKGLFLVDVGYDF
ncbi:MAG: tRNA pseudouridine(38-40) synthase TruA [Bergeyella sp.]|nr:tRNA pseudouridine(38-40) synthase TruA [Bergeyella sp.]